jgi:hypothetical protein
MAQFNMKINGLLPFNCFSSFQLTNSVAPEPEGSSPHSQQPASDPYPEPDESTPTPLPISKALFILPVLIKIHIYMFK